MFFCLAKKQNISLHSQIDLKQAKNILRGGAVVARWAHNPKVSGSNPVPATTENLTRKCGVFYLEQGANLFAAEVKNKKAQAQRAEVLSCNVPFFGSTT